MKTLLVCISIALCPLLSYSQKHEFEIEIDKLTGDTTFSTPNLYIVGKNGIAPRPRLAFDVEKKKNDLRLLIWGASPGSVFEQMKPPYGIKIRFKSGIIYTLSYLTSSWTDNNSISSGLSWFEKHFPMDNETYDSLTQEPIVFMRIETTGEDFDFDIPEKYQNAIHDALLLFKKPD